MRQSAYPRPGCLAWCPCAAWLLAGLCLASVTTVWAGCDGARLIDDLEALTPHGIAFVLITQNSGSAHAHHHDDGGARMLRLKENKARR